MALETTTTIPGLVAANPPAGDPVSQADDHIRLIKQVLLSTFPNLKGPVSKTHTDLNTGICTGMIMLWSGPRSTIPPGWAPCDGGTYASLDGTTSYTTPNLTERFVVMPSSYVPYGSPGGNAIQRPQTYSTSPVGDHGHAASCDAQGSHSHGGSTEGTGLNAQQNGPHSHLTVTNLYQTAATYARGSDLAAANFLGAGTGYQVVSYNTGLGSPHAHVIDPDGAHSHNVGITPAGGHAHTVSFDPTPAYFPLYYIMRM